MTVDRTGLVGWLSDADPALRWQVLQDLSGAPPEEVAAEQARVASTGWGARLLGLRDADGLRDGGARLPDGGWNCEAGNGSVRSSFDTTITVLDGLLEFERVTGGSDAVREGRRAGEEYLLDRGLFRRLSTGQVANPAYLDFAFPYYWHHDVLRGLDYFRRRGGRPDPRMAGAVELVRSKRQPDGRWPLDRIHPGRVHFAVDGGVGRPSRWNTLRALRVLDWWEGRPACGMHHR